MVTQAAYIRKAPKSVVSSDRLDPKGAEEGVFPALYIPATDQVEVGPYGQCVVVVQHEDALQEGHVVRVVEDVKRLQQLLPLTTRFRGKSARDQTVKFL